MVIDMYALRVKDRVKVKDGSVREVTANMEDGQWVETGSLDEADDHELTHAEDIIEKTA